jgi:hypothetical protein
LLLFAVSLGNAAHAAGWSVAETRHFRIYGRLPPDSLRARATTLEDFHSLLETMTTRGTISVPQPKLDIYILDNMAKPLPFSRLSQKVAGFYISTPGIIAAFSEPGKNGDKSTLLHEYAHHFMLGTGGAVFYPSWYVEGFAHYFETATFQPERVVFADADATVMSALVNGAWQPLAKVLARDIDEKNVDQVWDFYTQSWLLTHYLLRTPEMRPKFTAYLDAVAAGADPVQAFKDKIDPDLPAFQTQLRRYLERRKITASLYKPPPHSPADVTIRTLPAAAEPMLIQLANLEIGLGNDKQEQMALAMVRASAAGFPGDPLAERTLAYAEMRYGNRAEGIARLDRLLAAAPEDGQLLRWRGEAALPEKGPATPEDIKSARRFFARAFKRDPEDWRTLYAYAMLDDPYVRPMSPQNLEVLLRAHELAPQVNAIGMSAALALGRAGRMPEAAKILAAIAGDPHQSREGIKAARLLELAKADDAGAFVAAFTTPEPVAPTAAATES